MKFSYQAEKFSAARRALMLPHTGGEHQSIAAAFHECSLGLHQFNRAQVDESSGAWIRKLDTLMDTSGMTDSSGQGLWTVKAKTFTSDDKVELSQLIDELADWFDHSGYA